jgi:hypothetical protein
MDQIDFPWRSLGALLVAESLVSPTDLELALVEQRKTGRLLGQILVAHGAVSGVALARALARQHGVELQVGEREAEPRATHGDDPAASSEPAGRRHEVWYPLGRLLVERGFLTNADLQAALREQREQPGRRLGEILVEGGLLSGGELALALAEQHGVGPDLGDALGGEVVTVVAPSAPGRPTYEVRDVVYEPAYQLRSVAYESSNFLEAADFACDFIDREQPAGVEIQRLEGGDRETVWSYSQRRAEAVASSSRSLVQTFGFDPTRWGARP